MNKKTLNSILSWALIGLFLLTILSLAGREASAGRAAWAWLHNLSGTLMLAGSALHLGLHTDWVRAIILRWPQDLPPSVRRDRRMALWMGLCYLVCGLSGLAAWAFPLGAAAPLHHLSGMLMLAMLLAHIALHRTWYATRLRRAIERRSLSHPQAM